MRASMNGLPGHLRKAIRDLIAAGGSVARDGNHVLIDGPAAMAEAVRAHTEELVRYVIPSVGAEEAELVREPTGRRRRQRRLRHGAGCSPPGGGRNRRRRPRRRRSGFRDRGAAGVPPADSDQVQQGRKPRRQTAPRWRGRQRARSLSLQGPARPSLGGW